MVLCMSSAFVYVSESASESERLRPKDIACTGERRPSRVVET